MIIQKQFPVARIGRSVRRAPENNGGISVSAVALRSLPPQRITRATSFSAASRSAACERSSSRRIPRPAAKRRPISSVPVPSLSAPHNTPAHVFSVLRYSDVGYIQNIVFTCVSATFASSWPLSASKEIRSDVQSALLPATNDIYRSVLSAGM